MFWRKKKEVGKKKPSENVGQITIPPFLFEPKQKAEYKAMAEIIIDAEKYERHDKLEIRNALLIELKNQINKILGGRKIKRNSLDVEERRAVYERVEVMNERQRFLAPREDVCIWLEYKNEFISPDNSGMTGHRNPPPPKPSPIQEGRTKSNVKKKTSGGRQAPPPPPPPSRRLREGEQPPKRN